MPGLSKSGWAFTLLGGKTWGDGYIQGTEFEGYNWFVNITKRFNENHPSPHMDMTVSPLMKLPSFAEISTEQKANGLNGHMNG